MTMQTLVKWTDTHRHMTKRAIGMTLMRFLGWGSDHISKEICVMNFYWNIRNTIRNSDEKECVLCTHSQARWKEAMTMRSEIKHAMTKIQEWIVKKICYKCVHTICICIQILYVSTEYLYVSYNNNISTPFWYLWWSELWARAEFYFAFQQLQKFHPFNSQLVWEYWDGGGGGGGGGL